MGETMASKALTSRSARAAQLDENQIRTLESIRFQDQDQHTKCTAVLAFGGLMIATSMVQLQAGESSFAFVAINSAAFYLTCSGMALQFVSVFISMIALLLGAPDRSDPNDALIAFDRTVKHRRDCLCFSLVFSISGAFLTLLSLVVSFMGRNIPTGG